MGTHLNRRSFLARVAGASIISGGALSTLIGKTYAQTRSRSCLTDSDRSDAPDYGTHTGLTDADSTDRAGRGTLTHRTDSDTTDLANRGRSWRCAARGTGVTDNDNGPNADRAGYGRGASRSGISDSDSGANADPAGRGRGGARRGLTDNDTGPNADRAGNGRSGSPAAQPSAGPEPQTFDGRTAPQQPSIAQARDGSLPDFPWPPPQPTEVPLKLPHNRIVSVLGANKSLFSVGQHITRALRSAGYADYTFYAAPHGFAVVSRLERIEADGRPSPGGFRYTPPGQEPFSLSAYLSGLFVAPVGHYRQIVFLVTDLPVVATGAPLTERSAGTLLRHGADRLTDDLRRIQFSQNYDVTALIYEFQKTGDVGQMRQLESSPLTALDHLTRAGLYGAILR